MAKFLARLQTCLSGLGKPDYKILDAINAKKKCYEGLWTQEGFEKYIDHHTEIINERAKQMLEVVMKYL